MQAGSGPKVRIGLEVHCQLTALKTKLFCPCSSDYRASEPNEKICPVCFGLPGTLPVLNAKAVECATMIGLALNCTVANRSLFYRKNYFYPDLPKGFQISQYDKAGGVAIASSGSVEVEGKRVRITRIQLEEDPGKLTYEGTIDKSSYSLVDYNRAGIALVEIVTEPDIGDAREAKMFLERLRSTIESLGVSNGELDGAMRCDANISLAGGARVEVKNISSFKEVEKALNYEILRQRTFSGNATSETRHWDERRSITIALRSKEEEQDYRYFPEPDLRPIVMEPSAIAAVRKAMPEVADTKASRYVNDFGLSSQLAKELAANKDLSAFFEACARLHDGYQEMAGLMVGELSANATAAARVVPPVEFVGLVRMVESSSITRAQGKEALREALRTGRAVAEVVRSKKLSAVVDEQAIAAVIERVVSSSPGALEQALGDKKAFSYLVGQVLKAEPKAQPGIVAKLLAQRLRES
ncbi:MAG TPA: Asp-tRNA(Asn)/Glu-tRNA(Gln) amidotransferase subunit GatB [Nitrososphaerales archaeon]|nr:Asp-tRNA(Asn)/Glu-tRNA(Gln) amidotransferase subunit GatB [Nitrososphaerales archaeon]